MSNVFLSLCGTSLLTNTRDNDLRQILIKTANYQEKDFTPEEKEKIDEHIQQRRQQVLNSNDNNELKRLSAELNGIITYLEKDLHQEKKTPDFYYCVVTDTYLGQQVGNIIVDWLKQQSFIAEVVDISDLATNNRDNFRLAMSELINWCHKNLTDYRKSGYKIIFNLTGGFKSVQGFLQAIGMFYADECVYIFQFSNELLQIPRLPISLDIEGIVGNNLAVFRRLGLNQPVSKAECVDIPETLLFFLDDDNQVSLSEWGELVWFQAKSYYYQQELLPSLSEKLIYSSEFAKGVLSLAGDRLELINYRCDQLSLCLDSLGSYNPNSLDFKKLKGKPWKDSTHECDAWSDQDAQRLYGHYLGDGKYQIDRLGKHL